MAVIPGDDPRGGSGPLGESPAGALGEVWEALDVLPRARATAPLAATTLEMVAATVTPQGSGGPSGWSRHWLGPFATVCAALVCGLVVGRITAPDGDGFLLRNLPLVRHLDLLRELHSVEFLAEIDRSQPPPRRMLQASGPIDLRAEQARLADEIAALRRAGPWGDDGPAAVAERRREVARLEPEERDRLREQAAEFADLSPGERRRLEAVAAAIIDPAADGVRDAARRWRLWVAASDPLERDEIIELDAARRLEWMRRESRVDAFVPLRPRGPNGEFRRPQGPRLPDGPREDGPGPDPRRRPGPLNPDRPGPAGPPPVDAGETRAAPD